MAITGSAAALAGSLIYKKNRADRTAKDQQATLDAQVADAKRLAAADATANDPLKRAAEDAQRARSSRMQAQRALAAGSRSRSTLLTTPLGGTGERKTLLGS